MMKLRVNPIWYYGGIASILEFGIANAILIDNGRGSP